MDTGILSASAMRADSRHKTVTLRDLFKPLVVIGAISAGVLDAMNISIVVTNLMEEGSTDVFNRAIKGPSSNIDLMGAAQRRDPGILS